MGDRDANGKKSENFLAYTNSFAISKEFMEDITDRW